MKFDNLKPALDDRILAALATTGFHEATEVQLNAFEPMASGKDVTVTASTGTGKTLAFLVPLAHRLMQPAMGSGPGPRAILLSPTRDLGEQLWDVTKGLLGDTKLKLGRIIGGESMAHQIKLWQRPTDLIVATPGRLIDHLNANRVPMYRLETMVVDEADRMLDLGFKPQLDRIARACGDKRQTALFTATLDKRVRALAANLLKSPVDVRLADVSDIPDSIDHAIYFADDHNHKMEILDKLLARDDVGQAIIFATTQEAAAELGERLIELGQHVGVVHGGMDTPDRLTVVNAFREQEVRLLVATDVAARGMDVPEVGHVIQVNAPIFAEDYVHRVGRTGRAGRHGTAWLLASPTDRQRLAKVERLLGRTLAQRTIPGLEPTLRTGKETARKAKPLSRKKAKDAKAGKPSKKAKAGLKPRKTKKGGKTL